MQEDVVVQSVRYRTIAEAHDDIVDTSFSPFATGNYKGKPRQEIEDAIRRELRGIALGRPLVPLAHRYAADQQLGFDNRMNAPSVIRIKRSKSQSKAAELKGPGSSSKTQYKKLNALQSMHRAASVAPPEVLTAQAGTSSFF